MVEDPKNANENELPENWDQDDALFAEAFKNIPKVHVSAEFLPRVMSRVHAHHARANIKLAHVAVLSGLLLLLSLGFFAWDVFATQEAMGLDSASDAFMEKMRFLIGDANTSFSSVTGILAASWQLVTGLAAVALTPANLPYLGVLLIALVAIGYGLKRWISSLHIMDS